MSTKDPSSQSSLTEATRWRSKASGHGNAKGAAGKRVASYDPANATQLQKPGQHIAINVSKNGFEDIIIGAAWDQITVQQKGLLGNLFGLNKTQDIDLDIGCLYELENGERGCIQAFGEQFGNYNAAPFIALSGDEREGDEEGFDERLTINGQQWQHIKRLLVYLYIYDGASNWAQINPHVFIDVPGEEDLAVTLTDHDDALDLCAIGMLENVRGSIKLTNISEYFPGHNEMDRAFGFGITWEDGKKNP